MVIVGDHNGIGDVERKRILVIAGSYTPPLFPCPSPDMSEETSLKKLAAAKKKLKAYKYRNSPSVPAGEQKRKKIKNPETTIASEDVPQDCSAPALTAHDAVLPASVPSPDICITSVKGLEYEGIPLIN